MVLFETSPNINVKFVTTTVNNYICNYCTIILKLSILKHPETVWGGKQKSFTIVIVMIYIMIFDSIVYDYLVLLTTNILKGLNKIVLYQKPRIIIRLHDSLVTTYFVNLILTENYLSFFFTCPMFLYT